MKRLFIILIVFICSCSKVDEYVLTVSTNSPNPFIFLNIQMGNLLHQILLSIVQVNIHSTFIMKNTMFTAGENTNKCFVFIAKPIGKCEVNVNEFDVTKMKVDKDSTNILCMIFFKKEYILLRCTAKQRRVRKMKY